MTPRFECGVCWYVYDPDVGDDVWQIPAGTAFEALPEDWRCPRCDGSVEGFLRAEPRAPSDLEARVASLEAAYRRIGDERMRDLPIYNAALRVEGVGFAPHEPHVWLGVLVTPWFMNAVRLPADATLWSDRAEGDVQSRALPSGRYDFTLCRVEGVGPLETCSLISPMGAFDDPDVAREVAREAVAELLRAPSDEPDEPDEAERAGGRDLVSRHPVSRRGLLRGRLVGGG